jgi:hypothetical protein
MTIESKVRVSERDVGTGDVTKVETPVSTNWVRPASAVDDGTDETEGDDR